MPPGEQLAKTVGETLKEDPFKALSIPPTTPDFKLSISLPS